MSPHSILLIGSSEMVGRWAARLLRERTLMQNC